MLAAVATEDKIALGGIALLFIVFALLSSMVIPRWRPEFPGKRRNLFLVATGVLFVAMLAAVELFAVEEEEHAAEAAEMETTEHASESGSETVVATQASGNAQVIEVVGTEFKFELPRAELAPGTYAFELHNEGETPHDLVVEGESADDHRTPVIGPGKTARVTVALEPGEYKVYCSVPGHEEAGMRVELTVG